MATLAVVGSLLWWLGRELRAWRAGRSGYAPLVGPEPTTARPSSHPATTDAPDMRLTSSRIAHALVLAGTVLSADDLRVADYPVDLVPGESAAGAEDTAAAPAPDDDKGDDAAAPAALPAPATRPVNNVARPAAIATGLPLSVPAW